MYQERNNSNEWLKIILRLIIVVLVFILTLKFIVILGINTSGKKNNTLQNNLEYIDNCAKKYFNEENIPKQVGEFKEYSINDILSSNEIKEMNDLYTTCDYKDSTIKVIRLDNEYQIKIVLNCNGETNYMNSFVTIKDDYITIPVTTTKKAKITTKKKTTTKTQIKYRISFNTNGGEYIEDKYYKENAKIDVVPKREGYTFVGWYYNGKPFNGTVDRNYVLVAKWIKN